MSTVYSLICWGGSAGKSTTVDSSADTLTITSHGVRDKKAVRFSSGTLPTVAWTALALDTVYYLKPHASNYDLAYLYYDEALTSQVDFTSTGSSLILKSDFYLSLASTTRWDGGIYDSLRAASTARIAATNYSIDEVFEIGEAFRELVLNGTTGGVGQPTNSKSNFITTTIDGVRTAAYHQGQFNTGYSVEQIYTAATTYNVAFGVGNFTRVDGFTCVSTVASTSYSTAMSMANLNTRADNMICIGSLGSNNKCISVGTTISTLNNCIAVGGGWGISIAGDVSISRQFIANCIASKCTNGIGGSAMAAFYTFMYNCVAYKNVTSDWTSYASINRICTNNGGSSAKPAWMVGTGSTRITCTDSDFVSIGTTTLNLTTDDLRPASGSVLIDAGFSDHEAITFFDIADAERPSYENGTTTYIDVGPYEFDHGYGPTPASTTVTFDGVNAGSEIRVYNASGTELTGVETCDANHVLTWTVATGVQRIVIVHLDYRIKDFTYTNIAGAQTIPIQQELDSWYSNPA